MDGLISLASAALSVAADAILKPLRYAKNGIKEIFETIVKKLPDLPSAASKILKGLANTVDGLWLVGRKIKDSIIKGINAVVEFIARHTREAYQSIRSKLIKEVKETATEAATKGVGEEITEKVVKETTEDVIEDSVQTSVKNGVSDTAIKGAGGPKKPVDINNPVLDNVRTGSALKSDAQHAFNDIIDNYAGDATKFTLKGGDGVYRSLYQLEGSLNGKKGIFEWIIDPDPAKGVTHRRFIENVGITGKPNARP